MHKWMEEDCYERKDFEVGLCALESEPGLGINWMAIYPSNISSEDLSKASSDVNAGTS